MNTYREVLAAKYMSPEIHDILASAVKIMSFIKSHTFNSTRLFSILCKEMGSTHTKLLLYTEIAWLSQGCVMDFMSSEKKYLHFSLIIHQI